ncbi:MAG: oligoendopeptidase F [Acidibacillus sp.]|uniref:Oligopeptidase F n=1 Tax=Sulfoacidibacillus ferrooxidans TaxID=2005001 RepID=A0A9X2AED4_9BACL|nr:oligoendopeptidase F [Sulfoacidibacillus ferrooxidans]MCI0182996.1 Oligoendopeptidase F, plasmid [Sulfoacidibacillus ferrooxidans]MCY0892660.1 oligoendopeptidase F [Acidibacillus sp.]
MQERLRRKDVPEELTWNVAALFPSVVEFEKEITDLEKDVATVTQFKGRLHEGSANLLAAFLAKEALSMRLVRVYTYASLKSSEDGTNSENQSASSKVAGLMAHVNAMLSFFEAELLALPSGTLEHFLKEEPQLADFQKYITELLDSKAHQLSAETEEALASLGEVHNAPYMIYQRSKSSDMQFQPVKNSLGQVEPVSFALFEDHYEQSPDHTLRRAAFTSFTHTLDQYKNTFAATYATEVKKQIALSRMRKYESVTDMLLEPQQVSTDMYHHLLDIIQTELAPHMQRFIKLRQRVLKLDQMLYCDLKAPLDPEFTPSMTFKEASELIVDALRVLGPEYTDIIKTALSERWVDLADNIGKSTGAFCSSPYGVHPFILITWTDTMRSAFVLAHELGHAGHFSLANRYQRMVNTRPSMYFVEAPSTMNEMLLGQHILAKSEDKRMRRWVISQLLGTYYHNYVTHLLEAELQRRVYAMVESGQALTAKVLSEQMGEVLSKFWGDTVQIDDGARLTWMRQPHYYMGLYPYTYSAGLTLSTLVSQLIQQEGKTAVDRWIQVLKAGGTMKPLDLMRLAGVDMSQPEPIRQAVAYVGRLVDELEASF